MDFRLLRTFDMVATLMGFNRAAQALHCTQSTVSAQITALEADLGTRVFERLGRRIALTPAGEELRRHTRRLLSYEHEVRTAIKGRGETVGLLSLRAPQSVVDQHLPSILRRFSAAFPRVGFDVANCGYYQLADELRSGMIDAGFILATPTEGADLHTTVVLSEPMAWVASPGSALARRARLTLQDLAGRTLLLAKHDCGYRMELEQSLREARVELAAVIELNSLAALVQCLAQGLGVALLPRRAVADELARGRLRQLDWHEPLACELFLMRHRDKPLTGAYGAFIGAVEEYFAAQRAPAARGRAAQRAPAARGRAATRTPAPRATRRPPEPS
jgi:DNA-binding transcriptional LysR family regulator